MLKSTYNPNYSQVPVFLSLTQVLQEQLRSKQQKDRAFPEGAPAPQEVSILSNTLGQSRHAFAPLLSYSYCLSNDSSEVSVQQVKQQ